MTDVSIIIPVYFNEGAISKTIEKIKDTVIAKNPSLKFEIICIDDGSGDNSLNELKAIQEQNRDLLRIIKFTRNFGQVQAMLAGYKASRGNCVINISADMQDPPELMNEMIDAHYNEKLEIVIATRVEREESYYRKVTSQFFYKIMQQLSFPNMPVGGFDYALLGRKIVDIINNNKDANPFWQGQILWTGFPVKFIPYTRKVREIGKSRWTLSKKIKYLIDGVLGYSYFPLRAMSVIGILVFVSGFIYSLIIVVAYFLGNIPMKGWAPVMITLLLLLGLVMLMLGVVGEYLWRILEQLKSRPGFLIDEVIEEKH